ncbi:MAG: imelysin family protein [Pseudomonadota bacterium]
MRRFWFWFAVLLWPFGVAAQDPAVPINAIVNGQIIGGFKDLRDASLVLSEASDATCDAADTNLRQSYKDAFLAWAKVGHFRFGPTEELNRGFALAFWPDPRGKTPKTLRSLIANADEALLAPETFQDQSVAIRGFYALDYLLFDESLAALGNDAYRCALTQAITNDIKTNTAELAAAWSAFTPSLLEPKPDGVYRTETEVAAALFNAVLTGMQFNSEMRLGRPLGTPERPRPKRAEARRSNLSRDLLRASLSGTVLLAQALATADAELAQKFESLSARTDEDLIERADLAFSDLDDPIARLRLEAIKTVVDDIWRTAALELGPLLGVAAGFNSLDGD